MLCRLFAMHLTLASLLLFAAVTFCASSAPHVIHEARLHLPTGWTYRSPAEKSSLIPIRIGLKQSNLHTAHDVLMEVSDPDSPKYGQHWTDKDIVAFFAPSKDTVASVREWLTSAGVNIGRISHSPNRGWLDFEASISELEVLLQTDYHMYTHETGKHHLACDSYYVPLDVQRHIDFITPTVHFDTKVREPTESARRRRSLDDNTKWTGPALGTKKLPKAPIPGQSDVTRKDLCGEYIIPWCLRKLYGLPKATLNLSSFGIVEYFPETYLQSDLDLFQNNTLADLLLDTNTGGIPVGTAPFLERIDGGNFYTAEEGFEFQGEPDLDLEYAMDLAYPQQVTLLQVGDDNPFGASFNNFLG